MFPLVPAYPGSPGQKVVKRLCVCVSICKRDDDVDLRRLRQTMCLAHWFVCPPQVSTDDVGIHRPRRLKSIYLGNEPGMQASINRCMYQARINWEGCGRKGIRCKTGGIMGMGAPLLRMEWHPHGLLVPLPPLSSPAPQKSRRFS